MSPPIRTQHNSICVTIQGTTSQEFFVYCSRLRFNLTDKPQKHPVWSCASLCQLHLRRKGRGKRGFESKRKQRLSPSSAELRTYTERESLKIGSFLDIGLTVILQLVLLMAMRLSKEHITAYWWMGAVINKHRLYTDIRLLPDRLLRSITYSEILCDLFVTGKIISGKFESDPRTFLLGITLSQIFLDTFSNFELFQPSISHTVSISSSPWKTC